jgi:hypothetical protein
LRRETSQPQTAEPDSIIPFSLQSPAEPASTAIPAAAKQQKKDNDNDEESGSVHIELLVAVLRRIFRRVTHTNVVQLSVSPFRSVGMETQGGGFPPEARHSSNK